MPQESHPPRSGLTAGSVADAVGGRAEGDRAVRITGIAGLRAARPGELTFVADAKNVRFVPETRASVLLIPEPMAIPPGCKAAAFIRVADVLAAVDQVAQLLVVPEVPPVPGVHPSAVIGKNVVLGENVSVGPCSVIEDNVQIGANTIIRAHVFIGNNATVGDNCRISSGVRICYACEIGNNVVLHPGVAIGGDGFGFTPTPRGHQKIPQLGNVVISDDVEIGSNSTIDRARFGSTRIGRGTKIDNLVMIAHNVQIGEHCILTAQVGIAGSTVVGDYVLIGAQAGLVGHIAIGNGARIGAQSGVPRDVPAGAEVLGSPPQPRDQAIRIMIATAKLPEMVEELRAMRKKLNLLCEKCGFEETAKND